MSAPLLCGQREGFLLSKISQYSSEKAIYLFAIITLKDSVDQSSCGQVSVSNRLSYS